MEDSISRPDLLPFFAGTPVERVRVIDFDFGTKTGVAVEWTHHGERYSKRYRHAVRVPSGQLQKGLQVLKDWVNGR